MNDHTCCAKVRAGTDGWRTSYKPCSRVGKIERAGKWYCGLHNPEAVADRKNRKSEQWEIDYQAKQARFRLEQAAPDLLKAAEALLTDIRRRHPGEALHCEYMIALDTAVTKAISNT